MKNVSTCAAAILAMLWVTPTHAQTAANGPYYATPAWDQTLPAASRFIVLSNFNSDAILDRETGLVWNRSPLPAQTHLNATFACLRLATGARGGWRLPRIAEMSSLFDPVSVLAPALPAGHPFTGFGPAFSAFWSSTEYTPNSHFFMGYLPANGTDRTIADVSATGDSNLLRVLCVRGGTTVDREY